MNINLLYFGSSHTYDLHVCTEVRMHACIYVCVCVCVSVRTCVYKHVFTNVCAYVCVRIYEYLYAYVHACLNYAAYVRMSVWTMYVYKSM